MRVLVFGGSSTLGFWATEGGWVLRLRKHYDTLQITNFSKDQPTIFNLGISGDSTADLLDRFDNETQVRFREELAFIIDIGANDSAIQDGKERSNIDIYHKELRELIDKVRKFSDKILFVGLAPCDEELTIPVAWKKDLHYTNQRIFMFEKVMREVCSEGKIPYVAVFETFKKRLEKGEDLFTDGLHPNDEGHELIFQLVRPRLDEVLSK
ncbi:MAG: GDSL-type esterase/lipase family protein [Patescibacteria group bacterium]